MGQGDAGSVEITATDTITIDGKDSDGFNSGVTSGVDSEAVGDAGGVTITTSNLNLTNGGLVDASTFGQGNAGTVEITASDTITFDGEDSDGSNSGVTSGVASVAEGDAGGVTITTGNLNLTNGGQVSTTTFGQGDAGSVEITASDSITFDGKDSDGISSAATSEVGLVAEGDAGGVTITTGNLNLTNGGQVSTTTLGRGNAGTVEITASDSITFDGENSGGDPSAATSQVAPDAVGNAGGVTITTGSLTLTNGGRVDASTFGQGNAGSIEITASDTITIDGENSEGLASGAISVVASSAVGDAGGVTITTGSLNLTNGGQVSASIEGQGNAGSVEITASDTITFDGESSIFGFLSGATSLVNSNAEGDAGGVTITTGSLSLTNGGRVNASTFGQGNAGNVLIESNSLELIGTSINSEDPSAIFALSDNVNPAGNLTIETRKLTIADGASVSVSSPSGLAGNLNITANSLSQNRGEIAAETGLSEGDTGENINVEISDIWRIENESLVSATALGDANGGNININQGLSDTEFLLFAFAPTGANGSDIIANAQQGNGGRIDITAAGIFGIEFRDSQTPLNDFTVTSEFGQSGETIINRTVDDPTSGLINLPASVGDATDQISQNPCEQGVGSEFIVSGKGGIPPNVNEALNSEEAQVSLIEPVPSQQQKVAPPLTSSTPTENSTSEAVPAMGWIFNDKGEVTLTAYKTTNTETKRSPQTPIRSKSCLDTTP